MAWLKFDTATPEKPEIMAITLALGFDDPDLTVGKLLKVWRWFDQHSVDGNARGVTAALLDRVIGVSGMCAAMSNVGWLDIEEGGLSLPNFERHNGKTAKDRALTAQRVAKSRAKTEAVDSTNATGNDQGNAAIVTGALPREEKRREDSSSLRSEEQRASRLPTDWALPEPWREWAEHERPELDLTRTAAAFADYWHGKAGKDGRKVDWAATWRNWVRNERSIPPSRASPQPKHAAAARAIFGAPQPEIIDV
jgi:hypothetical protein